MKLKTFRIWGSDGNPADVKASSIEFKKTNDGLHVTFDNKKKIKGVIALVEIPQPAVIHHPPTVDED